MCLDRPMNRVIFQVHEILARTVYGKRKRAEVGVDRLISEGAYAAAFPLHEVRCSSPAIISDKRSPIPPLFFLNQMFDHLDQGHFQPPRHEIRPDELNQRQILYHYWARWCKWYKYQPLDHIREYFGEKIAFYFAWLGKRDFLEPLQLMVYCPFAHFLRRRISRLSPGSPHASAAHVTSLPVSLMDLCVTAGFYTAWLLPVAVVGTMVFVSGVMSMGSNTPA